MNKPLLLFVGPSGSGKTTIANLLEEKYDYKQVQSYTTRKPRYEGEVGHIFITEEEFDNLGELAAYTLYNGNRYGTTINQVDNSDIYVIDVPGVKTLLDNYKTDRMIYIIYFNTTVHTRINRMLERGDCDNKIVCRLLEDEKYDWYKEIQEVVLNSDYNIYRYVRIYKVDADESQSDVVNQVLWYLT